LAANERVQPIEDDSEEEAMNFQHPSKEEAVNFQHPSEEEAMNFQHPSQEYHMYRPAELPPDMFSDIVSAAAQAATMSIFQAVGSGALRLPYNTPDPPPQPTGTNENGLPDENQSTSQPFQRMCPCVASA
jgi:hypothetical protein